MLLAHIQRNKCATCAFKFNECDPWALPERCSRSYETLTALNDDVDVDVHVHVDDGGDDDDDDDDGGIAGTAHVLMKRKPPSTTVLWFPVDAISI